MFIPFYINIFRYAINKIGVILVLMSVRHNASPADTGKKRTTTMTTITATESQISVTGDYNAAFIAKARNLAGKWCEPNWVFDIRDEAAVRAAALECYGTDGFVTDLVDVRVTLPKGDAGFPECEPIVLFGHTVARAFGRDSGATLGAGVVVEAGGFGSSGSRKNWYTSAQDGTVVILRDVSRRLVERHENDNVLVEVISNGDAKSARDSAIDTIRALMAEHNIDTSEI
jgi:hypothetical protein